MSINTLNIFRNFTAQKLITLMALKVADNTGVISLLNSMGVFTINEYLEEIRKHLDINIKLPEIRRHLIVLLDLMVECELLYKKQGQYYLSLNKAAFTKETVPLELSGYVDFFKLCAERMEYILKGSPVYIKFSKEYLNVWDRYLSNPVFNFARDIMIKALSIGLKTERPDTLILCYGPGQDIYMVQSFLPESRITGIDFTDIFTDVALQRAPYPEKIRELIRWEGFGVALPFKDRSFDLVIFSCADPYIPAECREFVYKDIFRVLKSGGSLGILTWMYPDKGYRYIEQKWTRRGNLAHDFLESACYNWQGFYDPCFTADLLRKIGFRINTIMLDASVWRVDRP